MLKLEGVSKNYGHDCGVKQTTLHFNRGETTVLLGSSGCGKSTLLKIALGLVAPDTGSVSIDGIQMSDSNASSLRRKMGYVIQDGGLFPHLTAFDNIVLLGRYLKKDETELRKRVEILSDLTRMPQKLLKKFPKQLSGGQKQRVSLMRALLLDPEILFLDEPMGALDPMIRAELQNDLRSIFKELHKTVLLVTHDIGEAFYLGHQLILMDQGCVIQKGQLSDFIDHPNSQFVTDFVNAQRSPFSQMSLDNPVNMPANENRGVPSYV